MQKFARWMVVGVVLAYAGAAFGLTAEEKCIAGRIKAKGTYLACISKVFARLPSSSSIGGDAREKLTKCVTKYAAVWGKLSALEGSASCSGLDRFVDNGATVTDRLTLLRWEKKSGAVDYNPNPSDRHDPDNGYNFAFSYDEDGSVFSDFLETLNAYPGFENAYSWRVPTLAELLTISDEPTLGGAVPYPVISSTLDQNNLGQIWVVSNAIGIVETRPKWGAFGVRAVRGGL